MRAYYLTNVGNRDVFVDGRPVLPDQSRSLGERISRGYEQYQGRIAAPIIEAGLAHVLGRGTSEDPVALKLFLFATDQPEDAEPHRRRDTVHMAEVLKRYLPERFPRTESGRLEELRVISIRQNPSYYDEMFEFFGTQLRSGRLMPEQVDRCYVAPVGGVPAANFALLLRAVERYAEKCHPIYVPEGSRHAVAMDVGEQLRRGTLRVLARQEAKHYEFGRTARLLRELGASRVTIGLAEYAERRLHFDFQQATRLLEEVVEPEARGAERALALRLREELDALLGRRLESLIGELYHNALITHHGGRYVDFLLRLFRLQEAILRHLVERELDLPTEAVNGRAHPDLVSGIEADPTLREHMQQPFRGQPLDYQRPPTLPVLRHLVAFCMVSGGPETKERLTPLVMVLDRMEVLSALRNKSIGAHGFEGVSAEEIQRRYGADHDLPADLADVVRALGIDPGKNPFDRVRDFILERLG